MAAKRKGTFNAQVFLDSAGIAKTIVEYRPAEVIFSKATRVRPSCTSKRGE